ncbi:hypothetical protein [Paenibacillus sp. FSL H8-0034]|uniref:hypothetical protein n=1 Tax=Paenibacillus sp. FSL H8-0034 TaxID=2954671 RepID=UPI0030F6A55B
MSFHIEAGWYWEIGLKWRKDHYVSPAAKRFIEYVELSSSNPNPDEPQARGN